MSAKINIKVLVAPLDWGLGHATRCIPIITQLLQLGCKVVIACEGAQAKLLKTEFPSLDFVSLKGYNITYSSNKTFFALKIVLQLPKIFFAIKKENKWLQNFIFHTPVDAIISDNRFGLYANGIPSVFITHQLLIKAPLVFVEKLLQKLNYSLIKRFSRCWVPDEESKVNMSGQLGHPEKLPAIPVEYLGAISRLQVVPNSQKKYDLLVIISGPEPQRTLLETKMLSELSSYRGTVLLVRGLPANEEIITRKSTITIKNHLAAKELETAFSSSELIISRSGYTTVMDICKLNKKAILIPTPGQTEQEYLAKHLERQGWCMMMNQQDFDLQKALKQANSFKYKLPDLNMEKYKDVVNKFLHNLHETNSRLKKN